ncbi:hypothetical protein I2483_13900 [Sporosarcina sp. E16_3]|uniref:hypothetical protein n=1 Tax=Sporosarcina sp. E16_3 TaxID=2789293 RepID=UPI001A93797C|nr:hypothetical protein [Sporosarcina sp. E16_3]MBO0602757.1 hypothetical protein [Sporosarcina sp. E16_3]
MTKPTGKRTIAINADYRLSIDTDNIQIERLTTVDPTKAPAYDPAKHSPDLRYEWKSIGKYYATIPQALEGVLYHALKSGPDTDVRGLLVEFEAFRAELRTLWSSEVRV